mmetsp:Transcript_6792/g.16928  ORF Transcript_6792/g.16928 Transcript_6792/m.16928 type:complete len:225 (-) Transcript_6792:192-866(-)
MSAVMGSSGWSGCMVCCSRMEVYLVPVMRGRGSPHLAAASSLQGPMAMTTESAGSTASGPPWHSTPVTFLALSSCTPVADAFTRRAPRDRALSIRACVRRAGCTCAVVFSVPMLAAAMMLGRLPSEPSTQAGSSCTPGMRPTGLSAFSTPATCSVRTARYPMASAPSVSASCACSAYEVRASDLTGEVSFQSSARKPPALPEAAHATESRSTTVTWGPTPSSAR